MDQTIGPIAKQREPKRTRVCRSGHTGQLNSHMDAFANLQSTLPAMGPARLCIRRVRPSFSPDTCCEARPVKQLTGSALLEVLNQLDELLVQGHDIASVKQFSGPLVLFRRFVEFFRGLFKLLRRIYL